MERLEATTSPAAFTETEAATYLTVSPQFLRLSRHYGNRPGRAEGPPFIRLGGGRSIRYLKADLDKWLQDHRCYPAPLPGDLGAGNTWDDKEKCTVVKRSVSNGGQI